MLDLDFVRGHFPALSDDWALFDNAGGSVPPRQVIRRVKSYMETLAVQLGASYHHSAKATREVSKGRVAVARLIGAAPEEVVLASSTTANAAVLARALRPLWRAGDEVIVTNLDHEANIGAWRRLEAEGIVIREWHFDPKSLLLRPQDLDPLLSERTRLVCFTHCSNLVGAIHDVEEITRRAHAAGARVCVDGVAYAPHRRPRPRRWDVDFYLFSLYKTYGPHLGVLYGKRECLLEATGQNHFFYGPEAIPDKLEPGGVNHELTASLPGIIDYLYALHEHHFEGQTLDEEDSWLDSVFDLIARHEARLADPLLAFLRSRPEVTILGPETSEPAVRVPTIAFTVAGRKSSQIPPLLDERRIAVRWGDFYARRAVRDLGLLDNDGVVRVSMVHYNTPGEVERLVTALQEVL